MDKRVASRRNTLRGVGAAGVVALAGCIGGDDSSEAEGDENTSGETTDQGDTGTFRVGVLQDISGPNGPEFAHQGLAGFLSGLAYKNNRDSPQGLGDRTSAGEEPAPIMDELDGDTLSYVVNDIEGAGDVEFELLIRDTASDAQTAGQVANELIQQQDVDLLYGTSSSNGVERVNNIILSQTDVPLFVGQGTTSRITADAESCREQLFRATENGAMTSRGGAISLVEDFDIQRAAMFGVETSLGRDVLQNYGRIFDEEGVEVVAEEYVQVGTAEWGPRLEAAEEQGAEVVIYGFTGQTGEFFAEDFVAGGYQMEAFGQAPSRLTFRDIGNTVMQLAQDLGQEEITPELVDVLPFGPVACRYFWNQYDNEINDWLIDEHVETYSVLPDMFTSSAFTSASSIVQAFEAAGEASADAILGEVPGMAIEATPKGEEEYVFQSYNNQARSPITIAEFQPREEEFWPAELQPSSRTQFIDKDSPTTIPEDDPDMECSLF